MKPMFIAALSLALVLGVPALASDPEIPAHLLAEEARVRAALSPAARARVQALEARLRPDMTVAQVENLMHSGIGGSNPVDGLWVVMLEYQRLLNKEQREDRKLSRSSIALSRVAKQREAIARAEALSTKLKSEAAISPGFVKIATPTATHKK